MNKLLPYIIILLLIIAVAYITWDLKPPEYRDVVTHDTVKMPIDSAKFLSEATKGFIIGTDRELVKKYGRRIWKINYKDSLNIIDSLHIDTIHYSIPTLYASDTLRYSGFNLLNEDTLKARFNVKVSTLALLEPINAIENTIVVDSLTITVPPAPTLSLGALAMAHWKELGTFGFIMYLLGKL